MNWEKSCGAIVFTRDGEDIKYLLVQGNTTGIYGFPKGHMEDGESERETAKREIWEETGITVDFIDGFRKEEERPVPKKADTLKNIVLFLAEYKDQEIVPLEEELLSAPLVSLDEALKLLPNDILRSYLISADYFIKYPVETRNYNANRKNQAE